MDYQRQTQCDSCSDSISYTLEFHKTRGTFTTKHVLYFIFVVLKYHVIVFPVDNGTSQSVLI